jgi:hypothetical protein
MQAPTHRGIHCWRCTLMSLFGPFCGDYDARPHHYRNSMRSAFATLATATAAAATVIAISFFAYNKGYANGVADEAVESLQRSHVQGVGTAKIRACD